MVAVFETIYPSQSCGTKIYIPPTYLVQSVLTQKSHLITAWAKILKCLYPIRFRHAMD